MSTHSRRELLLAILPQYAEASWNERKRLLDGFVAATGYNRKHAITLLGKEIVEVRAERKRRRKYDDELLASLIYIWKAANRVCSKRLIPFLPELLQSLERFGHLKVSDDVRQKLLSLSASTADRILKHEKRKYGKGRSTTKPGHLIKKQIAVRTFADWNDVSPGFLEADLVAHCGETVRGQFLHTLTMTDIATGWTELGALLRRSEADVLKSVNEIKEVLPFPMLGIDTDNGGEFINYEVLNWCSKNEITFTRSREYRKNDQAHVEEKNGSVVRRLIGYDRYEGIDSWQLLSSLYRISRLYINYFQPCMKLDSKDRDGAHVRKRYQKAQTPYKRVLDSATVSEEVKSKLRQTFEELDPVLLLAEMERIQVEFWSTAVSIGNAKSKDENPLKQPSPLEFGPAVAAAISPPPNVRTVRPASVPPAPTTARPRLTRKYGRSMTPGKVRTKPGRKSSIDDVWHELTGELEKDPTATARKLINILCQKYPSKFRPTQRSTIHNYLLKWRMSQLQVVSCKPVSEDPHCVPEPNWQEVFETLRTTKETRQELWAKHIQHCEESGAPGYSYPQYCRRFVAWLKHTNFYHVEPDWADIHQKVEQKGLTRLSLWKKYRAECERHSVIACSYYKYCRDLIKWQNEQE